MCKDWGFFEDQDVKTDEKMKTEKKMNFVSGKKKERKKKSKSGTLDSLQVKKMSHLQFGSFTVAKGNFIILPCLFYFIFSFTNLELCYFFLQQT